jgi:NitT/TauT family transport system substrate-binding protein
VRRRLGLTAVAVVAAMAASVAIGGCSSDSGGGSSGSSSSGSAKKMESLSISYPGFSTTAMLTYVAQKQGFFKDAGVDVKIEDGKGALAQTLVVSGQVDLYGAGPISGALLTAAKGQSTTSVYAMTGGGQAGFVAGNPKTASTLEALQGLKSCKINSFAVGTSVYGFATLLKQKFNLKCQIVPFSDIPTALAAMSTGNGDAVIASYSTVIGAILKKQASVLVDTRDPAVSQRAYGEPVIESSDWGLTDHLNNKREAVIRYLKGTIKAEAWIKSQPDSAVAAVLKSFSGFASQTTEALASQVAASRAYLFVGSDSGQISEAQWKTAVDFVNYCGVTGFDPNASSNSYAQRVDMSYLQAARQQS